MVNEFEIELGGFICFGMVYGVLLVLIFVVYVELLDGLGVVDIIVLSKVYFVVLLGVEGFIEWIKGMVLVFYFLWLDGVDVVWFLDVYWGKLQVEFFGEWVYYVFMWVLFVVMWFEF